MFLIRLITLPFRLAFTSAKVGYGTGRLVGFGRLATFGAGVATGVLLASPQARAAARSGVAAVRAAVQPVDPAATDGTPGPTPATA